MRSQLPTRRSRRGFPDFRSRSMTRCANERLRQVAGDPCAALPNVFRIPAIGVGSGRRDQNRPSAASTQGARIAGLSGHWANGSIRAAAMPKAFHVSGSSVRFSLHPLKFSQFFNAPDAAVGRRYLPEYQFGEMASLAGVWSGIQSAPQKQLDPPNLNPRRFLAVARPRVFPAYLFEG